jgi:hypothetical protein
MRELIRWLAGYRDDLCLHHYWWHRLYRVLLGVVLVAFTLWAIRANMGPMVWVYDANGTGQRIHETTLLLAIVGALLEAGMLWLALVNIYNRLVLYVIFGPRR